jgi:hypothetical protein
MTLGVAMAFVQIARFSSRLEAETVGHALDQHEIPFLVRADDVGVFGPGMVGTSPVGAGLLVPEEAVDRVKQLLSCLVPEGEDPEWLPGQEPPEDPAE